MYLGFEIESGEITLDNERIYFIDIKVLNVGNKDLLDEDEYFAYECKRIDEGNDLEGKYVNNGILRFVHGKYSSKMPIAGMIGFIQEGSVVTIVKDLNELLKNHNGITTLKNLTANNLIDGVDIHYESKHERPDVGSPIELHHLMLDMVPILNKSKTS